MLSLEIERDKYLTAVNNTFVPNLLSARTSVFHKSISFANVVCNFLINKQRRKVTTSDINTLHCGLQSWRLSCRNVNEAFLSGFVFSFSSQREKKNFPLNNSEGRKPDVNTLKSLTDIF